MSYEYPRFDLTGQIALVTAAARGIGQAIALALAHAGADVALGLRDVATGMELVREIEAMGRRVLPVQMDMTRMDQIQAAIDTTVAHFGRLDILVNNAGAVVSATSLKTCRKPISTIPLPSTSRPLSLPASMPDVS